MTYKIEPGIPLPNKEYYKPQYPWPSMQVGDSIFVPLDKDGAQYKIQSARTAAGKWGQKNNIKFTSRKVKGGLRIWRVE